MLDKTQSLEACAARVKDGMTIGVGGWGPRRKPMALVRELIRQGRKDLTVVTYGGPDAGMLCAAGAVKRLIYGFVSLDAIPLEAHWRKSRESGGFEAIEIDEGMLHWGLRAAAMRLPFLPTRVGLGTDVLKHYPGIRLIQSPYDDQEWLVAMPALRLDAALIHASRADHLGNTQSLGSDPYFDDQFARAADHVLVQTEFLVPRLDLVHSDSAHFNLFERSLVTAVCEVPGGAHPTTAPTQYGWDMGHLKDYSGFAEQDQGFDAYRQQFLSGSEAYYIEAVGGLERVRALAQPIF
jgi:glutaconate CoA-transferase subunit A